MTVIDLRPLLNPSPYDGLKMAALAGVKIGDLVTIEDSDGKVEPMMVAAITESDDG